MKELSGIYEEGGFVCVFTFLPEGKDLWLRLRHTQPF